MSEKIPSGTHLISIIEAETLKEDGKRLMDEESYAIKVRFATGDNKCYHDEIFWTKLPDFKQLCEAIGADLSKPICPELLGKRLWGVYDSENKPVGYIKCENPLHEPVSVESNSENIKVDKREQAGETVYFITKTQKEKLDLGKKIIEETMKRDFSSLNQKNKPDQEVKKDINNWDDLLIMEDILQKQIDYLDACIEAYREIGPLDGDSLVEILPKICATIYFLEGERSIYHEKFQSVINKLVLEKQSVNRAENQANIEWPQLYLLRHKLQAAYECVNAIRSQISWIKSEKNSI